MAKVSRIRMIVSAGLFAVAVDFFVGVLSRRHSLNGSGHVLFGLVLDPSKDGGQFSMVQGGGLNPPSLKEASGHFVVFGLCMDHSDAYHAGITRTVIG